MTLHPGEFMAQVDKQKRNAGKRAPDADDIAAELARLSPIAGFRGLEVYRFIGNECPAALVEVGRQRGKGYQAIGAGSGVKCDLDHHDTGQNAYFQLIAWDPEERDVVSVYRYQPGCRGMGTGESDRNLRTANLFYFSPTFRYELLPRAIELGRSTVNPSAKRNRFGFFAIWKGLGALLSIHPETQYFFGTVSFHTHMDTDAVRCMISYLQQHYPPPEPMLTAKKEIAFYALSPRGKSASACKAGVPDAVEPGEPDTPDKRIRQLSALMAHYGESVPMILKSYMSLTNGIWFDGSVIDRDFSDACIISLIVPIRNINPEFRNKFMQD